MRTKQYDDLDKFNELKKVKHEYYNIFVTYEHSTSEYRFVHNYIMEKGRLDIHTADKLYVLPTLVSIKEIEIDRTELEYSDDEIWESIKTGKSIRNLVGRRCDGRFA